MKHTTRSYTKKNFDYWNNLRGRSPIPESKPVVSETVEAEAFGEPIYTASASYSRTDTNDSPRSTRSPSRAARLEKFEPYSNIGRYSLPFKYENWGNVASGADYILLCQKAYFHVPIFRNTIDMMAELSNDDLYLEGGSAGSQNFIKNWMLRAKIEALKQQFFREYFRSGNVFFYRLFADFTQTDINSLRKIYSSSASELIEPMVERFPQGKLPLKYALLNPADIYNYSGLDSGAVYKKILNPFEVQRLKNPQSEDEKKIFSSLTEEIAEKIRGFSGGMISKEGFYIDLHPDRLIYSFYKKQDYEPFAVPFGYPVLEDINWKLELKKIDQCVSRSVENSLLLITAGAKPADGGINPKNMQALKDLFANEAMGRVLVADYTTNAEFVIPDIKKIIGKEKYEVVNKDIQEGLQNIMFEESKYQDAQMKVKIFIGKIKEARSAFLNDFLQPEIKRLCKFVGFRDCPEIKFRNVDIASTDSLEKNAIRLLELGVFTPEMCLDSIRQGKLVDASVIKPAQEEYVEKRKEGWYTPLIGSSPLFVPEGEQGAAPTPVIKQPKGRPAKASEDKFSKKAIEQIAQKASEFESKAIEIMKKSKGVKRLSKEQKDVLGEICKSIIMSSDASSWEDSLTKFAEDKLEASSLIPMQEVNDLAAEMGMGLYEAALAFHSSKIEK